MIKQRIATVGLDPATYSGHTLRAGFLTSAAEAGASLFKLPEVGRHKPLDTPRGLRPARQSIPRARRGGVP